MAKRSNHRQKKIPEAEFRDEGLLSTEFVLPEWKLVLIHAAVIIAAGLWIYWPALRGDWIWDDSMLHQPRIRCCTILARPPERMMV